MSLRALSIVFAVLSLQFLASTAQAQEPESKPATKPAAKKEDKKADVKKDDKKADDKKEDDKKEDDKKKGAKKTDEKPMHRQIGEELASIKEVAAFLKTLNKSASELIQGRDPSAAFPTMEVEGWGKERHIELWKTLKAAGAHSVSLFALEVRLDMGEKGKAGSRTNVVLLFEKDRVFIAPSSVYSEEENFVPRGSLAKEINKEFVGIGILAQVLVKKAKSCKRSKNLPFMRAEDFELFRAMSNRAVTKEKWEKSLKRMRTSQSKLYIQLKAVKEANLFVDVDDAIFKVLNKDGKFIGQLGVDFDLDKKGSSIQFKKYRAKN